MMGGEINWSALPYVVEMLSPRDPELLITGLVVMRDTLAASDG